MAEAMAEEDQPKVEQTKVDDEKILAPDEAGVLAEMINLLLVEARLETPKDLKAMDQKTDKGPDLVEPPKPELLDKAMQAEAQSLGRVLLDTLTTASKSLLE